MNRTAFLVGIMVGLAVAVLAVATSARADNLVISHGVWGHYQKYLRAIGSTRPGAFAVTTDGTGAYYVWCGDIRCMPGTTYRHDAVQSCEREYNTTCVAFADGREILVSYTLPAGGPEPVTTSTPDLAPAPMTRISLSASAQETLDRYLRNSKSSGKAWALAITKDGSKAYSADCPTARGGHYGDGGSGADCNLNEDTAQNMAIKKVLKNCGGPSACVLLYRGTQKVANIEIAAN